MNTELNQYYQFIILLLIINQTYQIVLFRLSYLVLSNLFVFIFITNLINFNSYQLFKYSCLLPFFIFLSILFSFSRFFCLLLLHCIINFVLFSMLSIHFTLSLSLSLSLYFLLFKSFYH